MGETQMARRKKDATPSPEPAMLSGSSSQKPTPQSRDPMTEVFELVWKLVERPVERPDGFQLFQDYVQLLRYLRDSGTMAVEAYLRFALRRRTHYPMVDTAAKQDLVRWVNELCRQFGCAVAHPETGDPSLLIAINDKWGGKFALESMETKKRSRTSRHLAGMLPLKTTLIRGPRIYPPGIPESEMF